jgi:hypothetical protein
VPISQSLTYVRAATEAGARAEVTEMPGGHFEVIEPTARAWLQILEILDGL